MKGYISPETSAMKAEMQTLIASCESSGFSYDAIKERPISVMVGGTLSHYYLDASGKRVS